MDVIIAKAFVVIIVSFVRWHRNTRRSRTIVVVVRAHSSRLVPVSTTSALLLFENTGPCLRILLFLFAETAPRFDTKSIVLRFAVVASAGAVRNVAARALHNFHFSDLCASFCARGAASS